MEFETMNPLNNFAVVDTEDDTKGRSYLFGYYDKNGFKHFKSAKDLLVYINLQDSIKYVFCFNLTYDMFNILGYDIFNYEYFMIKNRLAKIKLFGKVWLDAYNHWNISIEEAGKIIGLNKISVNDYTKKVGIKYLKRDCEISYKFIEYMLLSYSKAGIEYKLTIASTSLNNYLQYTGIDPRISEFIPALYKSYYGGRVSVFKVGKYDNCYYYDINSAYPYAMANYRYPYPLKVVKKANIDYDGITECVVKSNLDIPILPYRDDKKDVYYCNGVFSGVWTNNELRYFADNEGGKILKIINGIHFKRSDYIFKDWVLWLYDKRLKAKTYFEKQTYKLILNSCYGKFGAKNITTKIVDLTDKNMSKYEGEILKNKILIHEYSDRPYYANVIWAAMITANVRIHLHKMFGVVGQDNLLYSDTDSIISSNKIPEKYVDDHKLGYFKLEKVGSVEIYAPKVYKFNDELKIKGVPKRIIGKTIKRCYQYERPIKLIEGLRRGIRPNVWVTDKKELSLKISNYSIKNNIVKPLTIDER